MTWCESHLGEVWGVPSRDDVTAAPGVLSEGFDDRRDLINPGQLGGDFRVLPESTPLVAVYGSEVPSFVGPLIPDFYPSFLEVTHIGTSLKKPQQLVEYTPQEKTFCGEGWESFCEVESHLVAEDTPGSCTRSIVLRAAVGDDVVQKVKICLHLVRLLACR
jgi:hypothetical protein